MKAFYAWLNERTGVGDWLGMLREVPIAGRPSWSKALPCAVVFTFLIEAITGFFLWIYYSPSAQTAWESVYYLQHHVAGGWLVRAIHHYGAHVLLALLIVYVLQFVFTHGYRAPRELVFWAAVGLGLCALAAFLTGDLLSWDQNGYMATKTRTGFLTLIPMIGDSLLKIAIGGPGPALGHLAVTRFFALHVAVFGGGFILLLILHAFLQQRANALEVAVTGQGNAYWPQQAWRSMAICLLTFVAILLLSLQHGTAGPRLLSPADPDPLNAYNAARPEWFLTGVFELSHKFSGSWSIVPIFILPGMLVAIVLAMPFVAKRPGGQAFNVTFTLFVLLGLGWLTYHGLAKDRADPQQQKEIAYEEKQAERVVQLARHQGIPPTGALTLLKNDPKTQGPKLFAQCANCHDHMAKGNSEIAGAPMSEDIKAEQSSAPNLAGFASRRWIAGLLNPKQISTSQYFGDTKFRGGKMAVWVKENLSDLDDEQKASLESLVIALSAEAQLPYQKDLDAKDAKRIEEGRKQIAEFGCSDCHRFDGKGGAGAPDLTGYGSPQWIIGIVRNPGDPRFYGKDNDRMPAYASPRGDASQDTLTPQQIQLITDWLRRDWYEAE